MTIPAQHTICVVGNDLSAWMACAFFINQRPSPTVEVRIYTGVVLESEKKVQSTLPEFKDFAEMLRLSPSNFLDKAACQIKLGKLYRFGGGRFLPYLG